MSNNNNANNSNFNNPLKRVFSVDDEVKDIENDIKYLEGLHDGLKLLSTKNQSTNEVIGNSNLIGGNLTNKNSSNSIVNNSNGGNNKVASTNTSIASGNKSANNSRIRLPRYNSVEILSRALENNINEHKYLKNKSLGKSLGKNKKKSNNNNANINNNNDNNNNISNSDNNKDNNNNYSNSSKVGITGKKPNKEQANGSSGTSVASGSNDNDINNNNHNNNNNNLIEEVNEDNEDNEGNEGNEGNEDKDQANKEDADDDEEDDIGYYSDDLGHLLRELRTQSSLDDHVNGSRFRDLENSGNNNNNNNTNGNDNESVESFTLKERQEAINETHPFGIRIWKPALYKKKRSIEKHAIQDIHETTYKDIPFVIRFNNMLWCLTCGIFLLSLCLVLGLTVFVCSGFGFNENCKNYSKCFVKVGLYLFYPFGKVVYIINDENYKDEDKNEGITSSEFYKWITGYRLFSPKEEEEGHPNMGAPGTSASEQASRVASYNSTNSASSTNSADANNNNNNNNNKTGNNYDVHTRSPLLNTYPSMNYGSLNNNQSQSQVRQQQRDISTNSSASHNYNPTGRIFNKRKNNSTIANTLDGSRNIDQALHEDTLQSGENVDGDHTNSQNARFADTDDKLLYNSPNRLFGRGQWSVARIIFFILFYVIFVPIMGILSLLCWLGCFTIPMSNVLITILSHMRKHPLHFNNKDLKSFKKSHLQNNILLCTFRCSGLHYYKYTVDGTNVIVMNLIALVFFTIFDFYVLKPIWGPYNSFIVQDNVIFILCLISTIPLAFYIGQGVASISAQTSMGLGAVINAFFSTIVEIFLYCVSLKQEKGLIVEGSLIGSILGGVLLLPGLSMCGGALYRKTQHYNPKSAGVSAAMLIFSMMVMFIPTILYLIYGDYTIDCKESVVDSVKSLVSKVKFKRDFTTETEICHFEQVPLKLDKFYYKIIKPISMFSAILLFVVYFIGMWFTLKTHAAMIWALPISDSSQQGSEAGTSATVASNSKTKNSLGQSKNLDSSVVGLLDTGGGNNISTNQPINENTTTSADTTNDNNNNNNNNNNNSNSKEATMLNDSQGEEDDSQKQGGHEAPNWTSKKSLVILLTATLAYAMIAEILVDCVDSVLKNYPSVKPKFLGLTIFALVPNTTEFLNAISFAMGGNVALSMEIGSAYVLQVCLLQIPALVIYSLFNIPKGLEGTDYSNIRDFMFTLVFTRWDFIACMVSVFFFTYLYGEGKSNYFKGSLLIFLYVIMMFGFHLQIKLEEYNI
ncbi:hypothetical protein ACO0RG_000357 [Hanseniaspora osmophila]